MNHTENSIIEQLTFLQKDNLSSNFIEILTNKNLLKQENKN